MVLECKERGRTTIKSGWCSYNEKIKIGKMNKKMKKRKLNERTMNERTISANETNEMNEKNKSKNCVNISDY